MLGKFARIAPSILLVAATWVAPTTASAQNNNSDYYCSQLYPGLTYEQIHELCKDDVPPIGYGGQPGKDHPPISNPQCPFASRLCNKEEE